MSESSLEELNGQQFNGECVTVSLAHKETFQWWGKAGRLFWSLKILQQLKCYPAIQTIMSEAGTSGTTEKSRMKLCTSALSRIHLTAIQISL